MQQNAIENNNEDLAETEDSGIGVGTSKQSKIMIIIVGVIFSAAVIYFFLLKEPKEEENVVPNTAIVQTTSGASAPGRSPTPVNTGYNIEALDVFNSDFSDFSGGTVDTQVPLPIEVEQPKISENIQSQIAEIASQQRNMFTREEVQRMIDDAIKNNQRTQTQTTQQESTSGATTTTTTTRTNIPGDILMDSSGIMAEMDLGAPDQQQIDPLEVQAQKEAEEVERLKKARALQERKTAPLFKVSSGAGPNSAVFSDTESIILGFTDNSVPVNNNVSDVIPTQVADLKRALLQGKIISAVLETAIDTSLSSTTVRAVITRDIYAEEGKNILIPRGSRVVGTYETSVAVGQTRVLVNWNRIIRVDGMSFSISSIGTDRLGRAGIEGDLDNKYAQILANSFLSSVLTVGTALAAEKVSGSTGITSTVSSLTGETTQTSGKASDYALIDATESFMDDAKSIVDSISQQKRTIRIPQGEKVLIMVNQDLTLPVFKRGN